MPRTQDNASSDMTIHGITLVKNEDDILLHTLKDAARWCDRILIYDTGSTDRTWDLIRSLASKLDNVVPFRRDNVPFNDSLRATVFNHYRHLASPGDWWCRLDADELYLDDPRQFLSQVPIRHHVVWAKHIQFYLTIEDLQQSNGDKQLEAPWGLPRYYKADASEARFFRHRDGLVWPLNAAWPRHMGVVHPNRIRVKHYKYRSPGQIQKRLSTRKEAAAHGWRHFVQTDVESWIALLAARKHLHLDTGDDSYIIDESELPVHLERRWTRFVKILMHGTHIWP